MSAATSQAERQKEALRKSAASNIKNMGHNPEKTGWSPASLADALNAQAGLAFGPKKTINVAQIQFTSENEVFKNMKSQVDYDILKAMILDAGEVTEPIKLAKDGELLAGESRVRVCRELVNEGHMQFQMIPAQYSAKDLTREEKQRFRVSDNASRFQMEASQRLFILIQTYPGLFDDLEAGEEENSATQKITTQEFADKLNVSKRQGQRIKKKAREVKELVESEGKELTPATIAEAVEEIESRPSPAPKSPSKKKPSMAFKNTIKLSLETSPLEISDVLAALLADKVITKSTMNKIITAISQETT